MLQERLRQPRQAWSRMSRLQGGGGNSSSSSRRVAAAASVAEEEEDLDDREEGGGGGDGENRYEIRFNFVRNQVDDSFFPLFSLFPGC